MLAEAAHQDGVGRVLVVQDLVGPLYESVGDLGALPCLPRVFGRLDW